MKRQFNTFKKRFFLCNIHEHDSLALPSTVYMTTVMKVMNVKLRRLYINIYKTENKELI